MLGLRAGTVRVCPYTLEWARLFEEEATRIRAAIGADILDIQHIGSTSVPGLAAKPIIDIGIAVANFEEARRCIEPLVMLGYRYLDENDIPRRHFFVQGDPRTHHVHMNELDSADWQQTIGFRDYLRTHPDVALAYADLKLQLAQQFATDFPAYHAGKDAFIKQVVQAARMAAQEMP
jgi:GrpB-like predicted nucleotidyltransferase (UPF0157 family)